MPKNAALALALSASPPRHEGALVPHGGVSDAFAGVHTEQTMDITGGGGSSDAPTTSDSEGGCPDEWPMSPLGSTPYYPNSMVVKEDMVKHSAPSTLEERLQILERTQQRQRERARQERRERARQQQEEWWLSRILAREERLASARVQQRLWRTRYEQALCRRDHRFCDPYLCSHVALYKFDR